MKFKQNTHKKTTTKQIIHTHHNNKRIEFVDNANRCVHETDHKFNQEADKCLIFPHIDYFESLIRIATYFFGII